MIGVQTENSPLCDCHGVPKVWKGEWRCSVKRAASNTRYERLTGWARQNRYRRGKATERDEAVLSELSATFPEAMQIINEWEEQGGSESTEDI